MHHMPNGEDYLSHKGILIKPVEEQKRNETSPRGSPRLSTVEQSESDKSLNRLEKEHKMKVEDIQIENQIEERRWRSCCFQLEPESSVFFAKLAVSCMVITLSGYQLITLRDCQYQSLYSSLLSSVVTYWLSRQK